MRKYQIHYLTHEAKTAAPEAQEHVAKFMEGVDIDNGFLLASNEYIGVHDHVTVLYIPKNYFTDNISPTGFLIEVFDFFNTWRGGVKRHPQELTVSAQQARSMLARSSVPADVIRIHPLVVERAMTLAHEFMCVMNDADNHLLKHLELSACSVILTYGPKDK